jgi:hypothetical protein
MFNLNRQLKFGKNIFFDPYVFQIKIYLCAQAKVQGLGQFQIGTENLLQQIACDPCYH